MSTDLYLARMAIVEAAALIASPHTRMRPRIYPDGDKWCALYGENLQEGVAGFGDTPEKACADFDMRWSQEKAHEHIDWMAADEITRLREALKPFAERADRFDGQPERQIIVMLGECRAARAALRE